MMVRLTELKEADIELVRSWRNSKEVSQYMYTDAIITSEQQKKWFDSIKNREDCKYWVIEYDGKKVGLASLNHINKTLQSCYWAFYIGNSDVRGAGIGGKVEILVLQYVFEVLKLNKLRCEVLVKNEKVIKMHGKFGFKREAYYKEHCIKNGEKLDVIGLAILQSEWLSLQNQKPYTLFKSK